jgi:RNA polymerase sigma factor (sigma-70 family)
MSTKTVMRGQFLASRSDDELVDLARSGQDEDGAYAELYRRHERCARNVARHIMRSGNDSDDVVNEAFAGVISAISNGAGPRTNFRQYLMACVRNSCKSRCWSGGAVSTDPSIMERDGAVFEDPDRLSEAGLVATAFSSLSPDWQQALWMSAVEERPTAEIAERLGRRPAAVAALAHRAREAFAEAYLTQHQARATSPACSKITPKLAHYVRGHSGDVDAVLVARHVVDCVACACVIDELRDVNASLRTLTGPAPLVGIAAGISGGAVLSFLPLTAAGGWTFGALSGAVVAKVAVLGALLVPAAIVAINSATKGSDDSADSSLETTKGPGVASADDAVVSAAGATSATDIGATGTDGSALAGSAVAAGGAVDEVRPVVTDAVETLATVLDPVTIASGFAVPLPVGGGATVSGSVGGSSGVGVGVAVTVPLVTLPISVHVALPPITTPAIVVPEIATPTISTPAIATPAVGVPAISIPDLGLGVPAAGVPAITVPAVVVPSVSVPTITLASIVVPSITLPTVTIPPLSLPNLRLPGFP